MRSLLYTYLNNIFEFFLNNIFLKHYRENTIVLVIKEEVVVIFRWLQVTAGRNGFSAGLDWDETGRASPQNWRSSQSLHIQGSGFPTGRW